MRKSYIYLLGGVLFFGLLFACTKEITEDLFESFSIETENTDLNALLDVARETTISINGVESNTTSYEFKYEITEGEGFFEINGEELESNTFTQFEGIEQLTIGFVGKSLGNTIASITIKDNRDKEQKIDINFSVLDFTVTPNPRSAYVGGSIDLLLQSSEEVEENFKIRYSFIENDTLTGKGSVILNEEVVEEGTFVDINGSNATWNFEGEELGYVILNLALESDLGTKELPNLPINITETPDFEFSATATVTEAPTNAEVDVTFNIEELVGESAYTLSYSSDNEGILIIDDVEYQTSEAIILAEGETIGKYRGTSQGSHAIQFTVVNANNEPITRTADITLNFTDPDTEAPVINLEGDNPLDWDAGIVYVDPGFTVSDNVETELESEVQVTGTVNAEELGTYTLTYNVSDSSGNEAESKTRTVNVVDVILPVIDLNGSSTINLTVNTDYNETVSATDSFEGNLTSSIVFGGNFDPTSSPLSLGTYTRTYNVTDSSGNSATQITRTINVVDDIKPVINLNGSSTITLEVGDSYTETATATDNFDGNLTSSVVFGGSFNGTSTAGNFTRTYNVSDAAGNSADQVTRTIIVESPISFNRNTGVLIAPPGSVVEVSMTSGGSDSGTANLSARNSSDNSLGFMFTCWGGSICLDDGDGSAENSTFSFNMPTDGRAIFTGNHSPNGSGSSNGTSFSIEVSGERFPGSMSRNDEIPR